MFFLVNKPARGVVRLLESPDVVYGEAKYATFPEVGKIFLESQVFYLDILGTWAYFLNYIFAEAVRWILICLRSKVLSGL